MKIHDKTLVIMGLTFVLLVAFLFVTTQYIVGESFELLEEKELSRNVARASEALDSKLSTLNLMARDYGVWDDTYYFVQGENDGYINETLTPEIVANLETNMILFYDSSRNLYYATGVDIGSAEERAISSSMKEYIISTDILFSPAGNGRIHGIISSPEGPLLIASHPITKAQGGEPGGTIIFARFLDTELMEELGRTTKLTLNFEAYEPNEAIAYMSGNSTNPENEVSYSYIDETTISGTTVLNDIYGNPALFLNVEMPRDIYLQGQSTIYYVFTAILIIGLVYSSIISMLLEKTVLSRLSLLSTNLTQITENGSLSSRVEINGNDELQDLAGNINHMLESLDEKEKFVQTLDLLKSCLESIDTGIMVVDSDSQLIMNQKFIDMLGLELAVLSQNSVEKTLEHVISVTEVTGKDPISIEKLQTTSEKDHITLHLKNGNVYDWYVSNLLHKGKILGKVYCATDITDSIKVQMLEQENKSRLETVLSSIISGVLLIDAQNHIIVDVNPIAEGLIGLPREKIIGNMCHNFVCPAEKGSCPITDKGLIVDRSERLLINKDGKSVPILKSVVPVVFSGRKYLVESFVDLTKIKEAEEKLIEAKLAAESANRAKSDFLSTMSHELRTPLNSIIGFSDILTESTAGSFDEKQKIYLNNISTSSKHLLSLINNVLDLSKIEAGKMELDYELLDVGYVINEVKQLVSPLADKKGIKIDYVSDQTFPNIYADRIRFKQILFNLASNAIKFTPKGGQITISAQIAGNMARFTVKDNGIGIAEEDKGKLFQPFMQLDSATNRRYEGTGLGLSLVKKFVEMHQGKIWFESTLGEGTSFIVELPLQPKIAKKTATEILAMNNLGIRPRTDGTGHASAVNVSETISEDSEIDIPQINEPSNGTGNEPLILVVEDDPASRELLEVTLVNEGYRVASAPDGRTALELARKMNLFAIILDIMMPAMDGWEVLKHLNEKEQTRDIPVIIASMLDEKELGIVWGAADHFVKPIDKDELFTALNRIKDSTSKPSLRVLVVDDEVAALDLIAFMLSEQEFKVLKAPGGREAIDLALKEHPDVILLDLMMPEVTGFDVIKALKANPDTIDIPIIICTAKELDRNDRDLLDGNVDSVIHKGMFTREELIAFIHQLTAEKVSS